MGCLNAAASTTLAVVMAGAAWMLTEKEPVEPEALKFTLGDATCGPRITST